MNELLVFMDVCERAVPLDYKPKEQAKYIGVVFANMTGRLDECLGNAASKRRIV